eukprot:g1017.t1
MSVDTERLFQAIPFLHFYWHTPLVFLGVLVQLWAIIGPSALAGILLMVGVFVLQRRMGRMVGQARRKLVKFTDQRVTLISELLRYIRAVKYFAWEEPMVQRVREVREKEVGFLRCYLILKALLRELAFLVTSLVAFVIFVIHVYAEGESLSLLNGMTVLAFLGILRFPAILLSLAMSFTPDALVALERLEHFLLLPTLSQSHRCEQGRPRVRLQGASFRWGEGGEDDAGSGEQKGGVKSEGGGSRTTAGGNSKGGSGDARKDAGFELSGVELNVEDGELVAIIGRVGSGKSSLLQALLGEMERTAAGAEAGVEAADLSGRVAYAAQSSYITNATLRDNVLFGLPMDGDRYRACLHAAGLGPDLAILPGKDLCEIGEAGINLSGGQKARVAIARVLYTYRGPWSPPVEVGGAESAGSAGSSGVNGASSASGAGVFIFDDSLSAVDQETGQHIFDHGISNQEGSILRGSLRLCVLNSHLHLLPQFERIVVMQAGKIVADGTYNEILRMPEHQSLMTQAQAQAQTNAGPPMKQQQTQPTKQTQQAQQTKQQTKQGAASIDIAPIVPNKQDKLGGKAAAGKDESKSGGGGASLVLAERKQTGDLKWSTYTGYFGAAISSGNSSVTGGVEGTGGEGGGRGSRSRRSAMEGGGGTGIGLMVLCLFAYGVSQVMRVGQDVWVTVWAEDGGGSDSVHGYWYIALTFATLVFCVGRSIAFMVSAAASSRNMHDTVLTKVMRAPVPTFFDVTPVGEITNRFAKDTDIVDTTLPDFMMQLLQNAFHVVSILALQAASSPYFLIFAAALLWFFHGVRERFKCCVRDAKRLEGSSRTPIYRSFAETLAGLETIRAFGASQCDRFRNQQRLRAAHHCACFLCFWMCGSWLMFRLEFVSTTIVFFTSVLAVFLRDSIDPTVLGIALVYALQLTALFQRTVKVSIETQAYLTSAERVLDYLAIPQEKAATLPTDPPLSSDSQSLSLSQAGSEEQEARVWPHAGKLEFSDVQLRYRSGPMVLRGVSFAVRPGEKVGVCGRTGAGKSSVFVALFRMVEIAGGAVHIDGRDVGAMGLKTLRTALTLIPQDAVLFATTVRENLDPFNQHSDDECRRVLQMVEMEQGAGRGGNDGGRKHEHEQEGLKQGMGRTQEEQGVNEQAGGKGRGNRDLLHEPVAELGANFSAGQRQLLCIARALLKVSKKVHGGAIVCLDEATSAVDTVTDHLIQRVIRTHLARCTVLTIAHRIGTIVDSDRILVLSQGRVVEYDEPATLRADKASMFSQILSESDAAGPVYSL